MVILLDIPYIVIVQHQLINHLLEQNKVHHHQKLPVLHLLIQKIMVMELLMEIPKIMVMEMIQTVMEIIQMIVMEVMMVM